MDALTTAPAAGRLDARTLSEVVRRAGRDDFDRWTDQLARCGHCARPVRLRGRVERRDKAGRLVEAYDTASEPDRVLMVRCGNRRAAVCPSCSREYAGDMWQLLYAGAAGGRKGVPETVRSHPLVFATLTAPGFGPVHGTRTDRRGKRARCRPPRGKPARCEHGRPAWCGSVHAEDDPRLGQPICADCYDYTAHAAFNWWAPELWRRFTIALRRELAKRAGLTAGEFAKRCRVSYAKVAEFQRRAVVHFHALVRLDGPGDDYAPPALGLDAADLADAITAAASHVRYTADLPGGEGLALRFGQQTDVQPVNSGTDGALTPERVAGYIAKYATKAAEDFGLGDRRITPAALYRLDVPAHVVRLVETCWELGRSAEFDGLARWLHMLGFRGHFSTKSRRYSVTLGSIRAERRTYQQQRARQLAGLRELPADDDTVLVVARWQFAGLGHLSAGDAALALSAAARARERRETARDEQTRTT